jgi:heptosyltransferase-3
MPETIIISRTDSIGDVVLTLPVAGAIRERMPGAKIIFLGRDYTREIAALSSHIDDFISWDSVREMDERQRIQWLGELHADTILHVFPRKEIAGIAARAGIPQRIGSTGRVYHYLYCNRLVPLSRKRSELHESQLNFPLLKPILPGIETPTLEKMPSLYGLQSPPDPPREFANLIDRGRFNLILHPKSKGSAREWPLENYAELCRLLPEKEFNIFVTGTEAEAGMMKPFLEKNKARVHDLTGRFTLGEFIAFIGKVDGLVAASTGPLHIAAALGKTAVGIYPPIRPMHPGRWAPVGRKASYLVREKSCNDCRKTGDCHCMKEITPSDVKNRLIYGS